MAAPLPPPHFARPLLPGGTSGVGYLERAVDLQLSPEPWRVRTQP